MTAQEFISALSQVIYLVLFVITGVRFTRRRTWVNFDTFLFFTVIAAILLAGDAARYFGFTDHPVMRTLTWIGVAALPYILLRLADDFRPQRPWLMILGGALFLGISTLGVLLPDPWPDAAVLALIAYFVAFGGYATVAFLHEATRARGASQRRMQAVALGSGLIALIILLAGVGIFFDEPPEWLAMTNQLLGLAAVVAYYVGFAPPTFLRRAWQEPAIRAMLADASELMQLPDAKAIATRIQEAALEATGADGATVGLWDESDDMLLYPQRFGETARIPASQGMGGRAFRQQALTYTDNAQRDAPEFAENYRSNGIRAIAAAPITAGEQRIGVLVAYAASPPAFTDDVLALLGVMAEQAALVFRSHRLLQESASVRALAEVTRLKDDFLSVVAHDVRTPLTTILINAELLDQAMNGDSRNAKRASALRTEALRLKQLVEEYLDVVRAEHGRELRLEPHDLVELVREAMEGIGDAGRRVSLSVDGPVPGAFDPSRIHQLVQNLVNNALKYSELSEPVEVRVWAEDGTANLSVTDRGIGIPEADLSLLFERFHRGSNTDDRRFGGLGLGLYICRQIAEEHGGSISVSSRADVGTTFVVSLDATTVAEPAEASQETA